MEGDSAIRVSANYLARQFDKKTTEAILDDIRKLVESGDFTLGAPLREFERRFSEMVGGREVIAVNSGTDALILALKALGIGPGDEVITVPNSFFATMNAIVAVGATVKFCDVDASHQMDPARLHEAITPRTKALLPVWWGGTPPDWTGIVLFAERYGLKIVEDACQGIGGSYRGLSSGGIGDIAAVSFHPIKTLNCWGDGGAVIVPNDSRAGEWLRAYRDQGKKNRDEITMFGVNQRLHTLQAVVLNHQLAGVRAEAARRDEVAKRLDEGLRGMPGITIPARRETSAWRLYVIEAEDRDRLKAHLTGVGVDALVHYPLCLHEQEPSRALGYARGDFPEAERQAARILSLPVHQYMQDDEIEYVVESVRGFYA